MEGKITEVKDLANYLFFNWSKLITKEDIQKIGNHLSKTWNIKKSGQWIKDLELGRIVEVNNDAEVLIFDNGKALVDKYIFGFAIVIDSDGYGKRKFMSLRGYLTKDRTKYHKIFTICFTIYTKEKGRYLETPEMPKEALIYIEPTLGQEIFLLNPLKNNADRISWRELGFFRKDS